MKVYAIGSLGPCNSYKNNDQPKALNNRQFVSDTFIKNTNPSFQRNIIHKTSLEEITKMLKEYGQLPDDQIQSFNEFFAKTLPEAVKDLPFDCRISAHGGSSKELFGSSYGDDWVHIYIDAIDTNSQLVSKMASFTIQKGKTTCDTLNYSPPGIINEKSESVLKPESDVKNYFGKVLNFFRCN